MLSKIVMKVLGKIEGVCAKCGSTDVGFVDVDGVCTFACKNCGSTEIRNVRFSHAKKTFVVEYVKDAKIFK